MVSRHVLAMIVALIPHFALGQLSATAIASHTYTGFDASRAVDGDTSTFWSSGTTAAASPYVELDLGFDQTVSQVRLLTSQSPAGNTTHVITGRTSTGTTVSLGTITGFSYDDQWLTLDVSATVRFVRIATTQSPSWIAWKEIQVYPQASPSGTINAEPTSCTIVAPDVDCDTTISWSTTNAGVSRVWIRSGPTNAGNWLIEGVSGSQSVPWIREGTYVFDLRQGTSNSGTLLASVSVTGVKQTSNSWVSTWNARPCVVGASDGETPLHVTAMLSDCPSGLAKRFWIAPYVANNYADCVTNPTAINCTALSGGQLLLRGGNAYNSYSPPMDGIQLVSETSFPRTATAIDTSVQLTPSCNYVNPDPATWDGCFVGLAISNGEDDYRLIGLFYSRDGWYAKRLLNRWGHADLGYLTASGTLSSSPQPKNKAPTLGLRIVYEGGTGFTRYYINGVQVFAGFDNVFSADPRLAIVASSTNTAVPAMAYKQYVEVQLGSVSVSW